MKRCSRILHALFPKQLEPDPFIGQCEPQTLNPGL